MFVLFLNEYELTAFLFIRLLIDNGKEIRNICKFSSHYPPNFALSELNPDMKWREPLTGWAVPTAAQRVPSKLTSVGDVDRGGEGAFQGCHAQWTVQLGWSGG